MKTEKGIAVLELAIVVPFFLIILFGLLDTVFMIRRYQYLSVITREIGNNAYRKCKDATAGSSTDNCLQQSVEEVINFAKTSSVINNTQILVQAWSVPKVGVFSGITSLKGTHSYGPNIQSNYNSTVVMNLKSYDANLRNTLITVEIVNKNNGNFLNFNRVLYETVIF